jgi:5'-nucleotidase
MSQSYGFEEGYQVRWRCAETHGPAVVRKLVAAGWPEDVLININFPDVEPGDVKGVDICSQGKRDMQTANLERRVDLRGNPYYWIGFKRVRSNPPAGTDLHAIYNKRIAVTPLHLNLTEFRVMEQMKQKLGSIPLG